MSTWAKISGFNRTIKRPNLRVTKTERAEIDNKSIKDVFNEIIERHFINPEKEINTQTQDVFWTSNDITKGEFFYDVL